MNEESPKPFRDPAPPCRHARRCSNGSGRAAGTRKMLARVLLCIGAIQLFSGGMAMAIEEPAYTATLQQGDLEVRDYPARIAAEVTVTGERSEAVSAGFRLLAAYIFGGNTRNQSIAMTAPVVQAPVAGEKIAMTAPVTQTGQGSAWIIRFGMPSNYTLDTLPAPKDPKVRLIALPATRFAVIRFSGLAREPDIESKTAELNAYIVARGLHPAGPPSLARYNPPWTLWFLRRNEVMIPLQIGTTETSRGRLPQ